MIGIGGLSINGARSGVGRAARGVLNKFGTDAHVWLPGVGYLNGFAAANYIDSAGTQAGLVDNPVGRVNDAAGAIIATQGTTANKPILRRGAVNLLVQSQTFSNASWGKSAINVASGATAPNASITAFTASEDTTTGTHDLTQSLTISAGQIQTYSIYVKASGRDLVRIMLTWNSVVDRVHADFDLANGTVGSAVTTGAGVSAETPKITAVGNGWYRCVISGSCPTGTTLICYARGMQSAGVVSYTGSGASAYQIWGAQLELGSTASEYIPTTTAAASSSSGNYYWQFDGSNDSLALSGPVFQMSDDLAVVAGCRPLPAAYAQRVFSQASVSAGIELLVATNGLTQGRWDDDAGAAIFQNGPAGNILQSNTVISLLKRGNDKYVRANGVNGTVNTTVMGTSTFTAYSIGSSSGTSAYFNGSIFPVIAIKGTVSDADLLVLERWVGSLSGVSVP